MKKCKLILGLAAAFSFALLGCAGAAGGGNNSGSSANNESTESISGGTLAGLTWFYDDCYEHTDKPATPAPDTGSGGGNTSQDPGAGDPGVSDPGTGNAGSGSGNAGGNGSASSTTSVEYIYVHFDNNNNTWFGTVKWTETDNGGNITKSAITYTPQYRGTYEANTGDGTIKFGYNLERVKIEDPQTSNNMVMTPTWSDYDYETGRFAKLMNIYGGDFGGFGGDSSWPEYNPEGGYTGSDGFEDEGSDGSNGSNSGANGNGNSAVPAEPYYWAKDANTASKAKEDVLEYGLRDAKKSSWNKYGYTATTARLFFQGEYSDSGYSAWSKWVWIQPTRDVEVAKLEGPSVETKDLKNKVFIKDPANNESNYSYVAFNDKGYLASGTDGLKIGEDGKSYKGNYRGMAKYSQEYIVSNGHVVVGKTIKYKLSDDLKTLATDYKLVENTKIYGCTDVYPGIDVDGVSDKNTYIEDKDWCFQEATFVSDDGKTELRFVNDSEVNYYRYFEPFNTNGSVATRFLPDGFYIGPTFYNVESDGKGTITIGKTSTSDGVKLKFVERPTYSVKVNSAADLKLESFFVPQSFVDNSNQYSRETLNAAYARDTKGVIDESAKTVTLDVIDTVTDYQLSKTVFTYKIPTDGVEVYVVNGTDEEKVKNTYNSYSNKYDYSLWYIGHDSNGKLYWFDENDNYKGRVKIDGGNELTWGQLNSSENVYNSSGIATYRRSYMATSSSAILMPDDSKMTWSNCTTYKNTASLVETPSESTGGNGGGYDDYDYSDYPYYSARLVNGDTGTNYYNIKEDTKIKLVSGTVTKEYTVKLNKLKSYKVTFTYKLPTGFSGWYTPITCPTYYYTKEYGAPENTIVAPTVTGSLKTRLKEWNSKEDGTGISFDKLEIKAGETAEDFLFYAIWK